MYVRVLTEIISKGITESVDDHIAAKRDDMSTRICVPWWRCLINFSRPCGLIKPHLWNAFNLGRIDFQLNDQSNTEARCEQNLDLPKNTKQVKNDENISIYYWQVKHPIGN